MLSAQGHVLPEYVQREFDDLLKCGTLDHGFLRVRCKDCHSERLVALSHKRRGFCPSCGARRMVESAAPPQVLEQLIQSISQRVGAYLEREGLLVRGFDNSYLQLGPSDESAMNDLLGHSVTYRIAVDLHVDSNSRYGSPAEVATASQQS